MLRRVLASVIVPTWKRPQLLRRALASLVAQTEADWQAVVVDGGGGGGVGGGGRARVSRRRGGPATRGSSPFRAAGRDKWMPGSPASNAPRVSFCAGSTTT